jgi:hypothetical protein
MHYSLKKSVLYTKWETKLMKEREVIQRRETKTKMSPIVTSNQPSRTPSHSTHSPFPPPIIPLTNLHSIPPKPDNSHPKRDARKPRLNTLCKPLPLDRLADLLPIDLIPLSLQIQLRPLLARTLSPRHSSVDARAGHKREDRRVEQVRVPGVPRGQQVCGEEREGGDVA